MSPTFSSMFYWAVIRVLFVCWTLLVAATFLQYSTHQQFMVESLGICLCVFIINFTSISPLLFSNFCCVVIGVLLVTFPRWIYTYGTPIVTNEIFVKLLTSLGKIFVYWKLPYARRTVRSNCRAWRSEFKHEQDVPGRKHRPRTLSAEKIPVIFKYRIFIQHRMKDTIEGLYSRFGDKYHFIWKNPKSIKFDH